MTPPQLPALPFGIANVPLASVPIRLPSITAGPPASTPALPLPDNRLRCHAKAPPTCALENPLRTPVPPLPLPGKALPSTVVPMKLP
jgi:hypothetical protein